MWSEDAKGMYEVLSSLISDLSLSLSVGYGADRYPVETGRGSGCGEGGV